MSKPELNLKLGTLTSFVSTFLGFTRCEPEAVKTVHACFVNAILEYVPGDTTIKNVRIECLKHHISFSADLYLTEYVGYVFTLEICEFEDDSPTTCVLCGYDHTNETYSRVDLRRGNIHEALKSPHFTEAIHDLIKQHEGQTNGNTRN